MINFFPDGSHAALPYFLLKICTVCRNPAHQKESSRRTAGCLASGFCGERDA
jgi:hypothetical protein